MSADEIAVMASLLFAGFAFGACTATIAWVWLLRKERRIADGWRACAETWRDRYERACSIRTRQADRRVIA